MLGCVNPASWLPLAAGGEFTQPSLHLLFHVCTLRAYFSLEVYVKLMTAAKGSYAFS